MLEKDIRKSLVKHLLEHSNLEDLEYYYQWITESKDHQEQADRLFAVTRHNGESERDVFDWLTKGIVPNYHARADQKTQEQLQEYAEACKAKLHELCEDHREKLDSLQDAQEDDMEAAIYRFIEAVKKDAQRDDLAEATYKTEDCCITIKFK